MHTKENNPCENAVSASGLALGLALAPSTVRVDLDKLKKIVECPPLLQENSTLHYALNGFLSKGSSDMPHRLFGALVSEFRVDPHDILPDPDPKTVPTAPFRADIDVSGNRLSMTVYRDGKVFASGKSFIKGHSDTDLAQAISYAAHIIYKVVEQEEM